MIKPFKGDFRISQIFGANPDMYAKFNYKGHNGIDFALPTGTEVIAPHSGKVIEAALDADGYGWYLKIENDKEGSVLGHNKELKVKVGDTVTEGQVIAISNNSGYSTGPHLHWGYYLLPRDRANGYGGFINQAGMYSESSTPDTYKGYNLNDVPKESIMAFIDLQEAVNKGEFVRKAEIENLQKQITDLKNFQETLHNSIEQMKLSIGEKDKTIESVSEELRLIKVEKQTWSEQIEYYKPYKSLYENALKTQVDKYTAVQLISMGVKKLWTERKANKK
jgi:septal ring factor EnvC (AmiA/AmiB activator)